MSERRDRRNTPARRPTIHGQIRIRLMPALAILAVLTVVPPAPLQGADDGGGRSVFATGAGNRALALGGAFTAVADDPSAALWNPAGLGLLQRRELQLTQTRLFGLGFSEQYASLVLPNWRWGTVAATWRRFGVDGIEQRDDRGFLLDDDLRDAQTELLLGYGRSLLGGDLALGGAFKVRHHQLAGHADSGLGLDLGLWLRPLALASASGAASRSLALGLTVRNALEPQIKLASESVPDPIAMRVGLAWTQHLGARLRLLALADIEQTRGMDSRVHAGIETALEDLLALRFGSSNGRLTAGAGLSWKSWGIDYQFEDNHLGSIHRFGVALAFGPTVMQNRLAAQAAADEAIRRRLDAAFASRSDQHEQQFRLRAQQAISETRWDDALIELNTLQVLAPEAPDLPALMAEAWYGRACQQEQEDDLVESALSLRRVLAVMPDHAEAALDLRRIQDAIAHNAQRSREISARWEMALDALAGEDLVMARDGFAAVLALAPNDREAGNMLEFAERAIARQAAVTALVPSRHATTSEAAVTQISGAPPAQPATVQPAAAAPASAELSMARRREVDDLYRRGMEAMQADRRAEAVHYWELVLSADPAHSRAREYLTSEYLAQGMESFADGALREAVASWQQAARVDPDDPRARGYLERALQQLARMEQIAESR